MSEVAEIPYLPIISRPRIVWPNGARVALWVAPNIEHYQYLPPRSDHMRPWPRLPTPPDVLHYSYYDYGNRIGFWRLLEVLDHHAVRATASLNLSVLEHYPQIRDAIVGRDWGIMSHGFYNTSYLFGKTEEEERAFFQESIELVRRHTGRRLRGMLGPAGSVSPNTMRLMAQAGLIYSADWGIDDQPFPILVPSGKLVGVPYARDVNDDSLMAMGFGAGGYEADYFLQICKDQFDVLYREGAQSGRVMCIALHAYVFGHPHRIDYLDRALDYVLGHDGVWMATADEIAQHYLEHYFDEAVAHARTLAGEHDAGAARERTVIDERPAGKMDNPYYEWSPIVDRAPLRWPGGAPVALCVIVSLEALEWFPPAGSFIPPSSGRYGPYPEAFQTSGVSSYEYGNRVGVFRVMEVLDRHGIKATVAMDAMLARSNAFLVAQCRERNWEFIGHGLAFSRMITAAMDEADERAQIASALEIMEKTAGRRPCGWLGADYGESAHTVALLAEMGVRYVCDWVNDEQPYRMTVPAGRMVALPVSAELDDVLIHRVRQVPIRGWSRAVVEAHRRLARDGESTGRLLVLNLHPFLIGQPFRIGHLDDALETIIASGSVWTATGSEIVDWYLGEAATEPGAS